MRPLHYAALAAVLFASTGLASAQTTIIEEWPAMTGTVVIEAPVRLTPAQRETIYRTIEAVPVEDVAPPPAIEYRVGTRVPGSVRLYDVPQSVAVEVPAIRTYKYMRVNNRIVLVNPATSEVVDEIGD